jgi:carboxyl-terminal processing protease
MRGEPGTKVKLHIERKGEPNLLEFDLIRAEIPIVSVRAKEIEPGYAYIRLTQFIEPTLRDLVEEINKFYKNNPQPKGLVLDLRYNPGGVLQGAVGVSAAFLPKDVLVVSSKGQLAEARNQNFARYEDYRTRADGSRLFSPDPLRNLPADIKKIPMVVLINSGSASASEIVAGALQDYDRAKILGTTSFGKGSVQQIIPLGEKATTAVKMTIARYYTPKDRSIQAKGITPDFYVEETPDGDLFKNQLREVDLDGHLSNDKTAEAQKNDEEKYARNPKRNKPIEFGTAEDYQLQQAMNYLKGQPVKISEPERKDADKKADAKSEVKADSKTETKANSKGDAKADPKVEPKADSKADPKAPAKK